MSNWIHLKCPTCGASLPVAGEANRFACRDCGNTYLLERAAQDTPPAEREQVRPMNTYTHQLQQWLKVGKHEIFVREVFEEKPSAQRVFYLNVEYRNSGAEALSCRCSQRILFDSNGYAYDTASDSALL